MATKNVKSRKPLTSRTKGIICLALLLAATVFVSCLAIFGMDLSATEVLLPWVPVSGENWPASLPVDRALGGGTAIEYTYSVPENAPADAVEAAVKTMRARLDLYSESDATVEAKDGVIRLDLRKMNASRRSNIIGILTTPGQFEFNYDDGTGESVVTVLTEKDIESSKVGADYNTSTGKLNSYYLTLTINQQGLEKLDEFRKSLEASGIYYLYYLDIVMDGTTVGTGILNEDKLTLTLTGTTSNYNTISTVDFILRTGAVDVTLTDSSSSTVNASLGIVLKVVLWLCAALLALTLIYTVATGKLTGVSATLSVWCAVMLSLFLVATVVVPTIMSLNVGCLVAILLGILLAVYTAVTRTDAISKQITEGALPKSAAKLGFRVSAKNVWIVHAAALALALILMIFAFSRGIGYCLFCGVLSSAIAVVIMRAFQACFTAISNKASLFGKVK